MRTNYVLIDFENVQPKSLEPLAPEHFRVFVFVGAGQSKLPFEIVAAMQRLGPRAEYIKLSGNGPNALDFHIAYYIGHLAASDPNAYFHIISKDTGFDALIRHLKSRHVLADRVNAITEIPLVKESNAKSTPDRSRLALVRLQNLKSCRPRTVHTLGTTIASVFQNQLSQDEVAAVIQDLASKGRIQVTGSQVTYALPADA
ncbi:MAG: PIN domain-containing protein [Isosphaeraceae bacterium]